ncbi:MAG: hypothetical protein GC168_05875 [Candidatus Hydrogenedens sp.]|nr:hypothetical protein [Candidatus Hydrogenedens sp.]
MQEIIDDSECIAELRPTSDAVASLRWENRRYLWRTGFACIPYTYAATFSLSAFIFPYPMAVLHGIVMCLCITAQIFVLMALGYKRGYFNTSLPSRIGIRRSGLELEIANRAYGTGYQPWDAIERVIGHAGGSESLIILRDRKRIYLPGFDGDELLCALDSVQDGEVLLIRRVWKSSHRPWMYDAIWYGGIGTAFVSSLTLEGPLLTFPLLVLAGTHLLLIGLSRQYVDTEYASYEKNVAG